MYIGLIMYDDPENTSGGNIFNTMILQQFQRMGERVEVISLPWRSYYAMRAAQNDAPQIREDLTHTNFDILLQDHNCYSSLYRLNRWLRRRVDYPIIALTHQLDQTKFKLSAAKWDERRYLRSVDGFIFGNQMAQAQVMSMKNIKPLRALVYPAGDRLELALTDEEISERVDADAPVTILYAGNIQSHPDLQILISALLQFPSHLWQLNITGGDISDVRYNQKIRSIIEHADSSANIKVLGRLTDDEHRDVLMNSHIQVVPTENNDAGAIIIEGFAFGLPVIISTANSAREFVTHRENGLLIPPDDSDALARYLRPLLSNRDRLRAMGIASRHHFDKFHTWRQTAEHALTFLKDLVLE